MKHLFCPDCVHLISVIIVYVVINFLLHLKHLKNNVKGSDVACSFLLASHLFDFNQKT